jgi:hypothetical protein
MQGYAERVQAELLGKTKFLQTKVILVNVFGKVAANELFAVVVEGPSTVRTSILTQSRPLKDGQ